STGRPHGTVPIAGTRTRRPQQHRCTARTRRITVALTAAPEIDPRPAYHRRDSMPGRSAKTLPERDRALLPAWMSDPSISHSAISERIVGDPDYDVVIIDRTVARHRSGKCTCGSL